jgi:hypothetical protein
VVDIHLLLSNGVILIGVVDIHGSILYTGSTLMFLLQMAIQVIPSSVPPVICRRADVLFVRLYLQLFVGGLMYCLFAFTSSCL